MKNIIVTTIMLLIIISLGNAQKKNGVELQFPHYSINAPSSPELTTNPFLTGRQDALTKEKAAFRFGILYRGENTSSALLEFFDAGTNKSLKKISLEEYDGKENSSWKLLRDDSKESPAKSTSVFQARSGSHSFKVIRTIEIKEDDNFPLGKNISVSFAIESAVEMNIITKFYGKAEGVFNAKENVFWISSNDSTFEVNPVLVFQSPKGTIIEPGKAAKNIQPFTLTTRNVTVPAKTLTEVFSLTATGTTVGFKEHIKKQAENLIAFYLTRAGKPELIAVTTADKKSSTTGDTITYTIFYDNIGTGGAAEINLNNIIPSGTGYVDGSASGKESEILFEKSGTRVSNITWKFKSAIMPGNERVATFRVLVE